VSAERRGHHVTISAPDGNPASVRITIDGQPLKACRRLELRMNVDDLPVLVLEVLPEAIDVDLPDAVLAALLDESVLRKDEESADEKLRRGAHPRATVRCPGRW
jgi:hypothetical protein